MLRLVACIAYEHDLALVGLAALICATGALVSTHLLGKTMSIRSNARFAWGFIGAIAAGSTIWCTHFVSMLAYQPSIPITYDFGPTLASLMVAIVGCGISFAVVGENIRHASKIGGALFGASVAAMHYTGMMAFSTHAHFTWDIPYVVASIILAISIAVCAFESVRTWSGTKALIGGTGFLVLTIVMLHFTGMAAITINPYAYYPGDYTDGSARSMIAVAVAGVALLVLGTGAVSHFLDSQARSYAAIRLRHLAESAVDGMVVVRDGIVVEANTEFLRMTGATADDVVGNNITIFLRDHVTHPKNELVRAEVRTFDGSLIHVELTIRTETITDDDHPLTVYALRDISQRLEHEKRIAFLAQFDSLTGLRNRSSFLEQTANILDWSAGRAQYAVMAIDLNRFKEINDTHGHAAGDRVLSVAGERLKTLLSSSQMAARIGGDEFVIFSEIQGREDAVQFAERLEATFTREIDHEGVTLQCGASIGVALAPADGNDINTLLNNADLAMYRAKSSETGHICLYDKSMDDTVRAHRKMIEELRHAIQNDELELHYQVQMNVAQEQVAGYEALVRWNHPERGLVMPDQFIPLAEQTGLIVKLGEWVLKTACNEAASWTSGTPVSVNLSPAQLVDPNFCEMLLDILWVSGLDPKRLELEVTETCFIADQGRAIAVLKRIKKMGMSVSIDDFGTGYSSLAMLQAFPFDKIKLDKCLVDTIAENQTSKGVFRAVLSLGEALSVPILAEGVESSEQLAYLRLQGCDLVQGYYYGRPEPIVNGRGPTNTHNTTGIHLAG